MVNKIFYTTLIFCCFSCYLKKKVFRYVKNNPNQESSLRMNGYYYTIYYEDKGIIDRYFFYRNGKVLYSFGCTKKTLNECEDDFNSTIFFNSIKDTNSINWTNYFIKNDSIIFERIYPSQGYPHSLLSGKILNDTTFLITTNKEINGKSYSINDTFRFRQFYPKPVFIND